MWTSLWCAINRALKNIYVQFLNLLMSKIGALHLLTLIALLHFWLVLIRVIIAKCALCNIACLFTETIHTIKAWDINRNPNRTHSRRQSHNAKCGPDVARARRNRGTASDRSCNTNDPSSIDVAPSSDRSWSTWNISCIWTIRDRAMFDVIEALVCFGIACVCTRYPSTPKINPKCIRLHFTLYFGQQACKLLLYVHIQVTVDFDDTSAGKYK